MKRELLLILALLAVCASNAAAQERTNSRQSTAPTQTIAAAPSDDNADVSITANVTARELKFEAVPNPNVEFTGNHERITVWDANRQNLPRPVEPFVTYRNIGIQLKITSVFADIDRIVSEALGEKPLTDDSPQQNETKPPSQTPSNTQTLPPQPSGRKPE
ncbi:MAG: hypothetical protein WBP93_04575 [Pyrinomonadaceae bacterium]